MQISGKLFVLFNRLLKHFFNIIHGHGEYIPILVLEMKVIIIDGIHSLSINVHACSAICK